MLPDRAVRDSESEIDATSEMVEAGARAIFEWRDMTTAWGVAKEVYSAMERVRKGLLLPQEIDASSATHPLNSNGHLTAFRSKRGRPPIR